jgi:hypothetical protein
LRPATPDEINAELGHDGGLLAAGEDMQRGWRWIRTRNQMRGVWISKGEPGGDLDIWLAGRVRSVEAAQVELVDYSCLLFYVRQGPIRPHCIRM